MSHLTITLDGYALNDVSVGLGEPGWWADDTLITVRTNERTASYRLPRRRPRVVLERYGDGTGALIIGGFTSVQVRVLGGQAVLEDLRKRLL